MNKYELIIFDLDGTLADTSIDIAKAVNHVRGKENLSQLPVKEVIRFVGNGLTATLKKAFEGTDRKSEEAVDLFITYYGDHLLDNTKLYPSVIPALEHFKSRKK